MDQNTKTGLMVGGGILGAYLLYRYISRPADTGLPTVRSLGVPADTGAPPPYSDPRYDQVFVPAGDGTTVIPGDAALSAWLVSHENARRTYVMQVAMYRLGYSNQRASSIYSFEDNNAKARFAAANHLTNYANIGFLNPAFISEVKRIWRKNTDLGTGIRPYPWPLATPETIESMPLMPATQT